MAINPINQNQLLARKYRQETGYFDGVITIYQGEVQGWSNELRNPERWRPGCIAVDSNDNQWVAVGGNDYDGANEWKAL